MANWGTLPMEVLSIFMCIMEEEVIRTDRQSK